MIADGKELSTIVGGRESDSDEKNMDSLKYLRSGSSGGLPGVHRG